MRRTTRHRLIQQIRRLSHILIFSVGLNVALLATVIWLQLSSAFAPKEREVVYAAPEIELLGSGLSNATLLGELQEETFSQLVKRLDDTTPVEEGYSVRDLALGTLFYAHYFDIARALGDSSYEERLYQWGDAQEIILIPGMDDHHYALVDHFIHTEQWPLNTEGLFWLIKHQGQQGGWTPSLIHAFFLHSDVQRLETLLQRGNSAFSRELFLKIVSQGSWDDFASFLSIGTPPEGPYFLRLFLRKYLAYYSSEAAQFLVLYDYDFALHRLTDHEVKVALEHLDYDNERAVAYSLDILSSPRSAVALDAAARFIAGAEALGLPRGVELQQVIQEKAPVSQVEKIPFSVQEQDVVVDLYHAEAVPIVSERVIHVIQTGDTLELVSMLYGVDAEVIREENDLEGDELTQGSSIVIPLGKL